MAKDGLAYYCQEGASRPFFTRELLSLYDSNFFDPVSLRAVIYSARNGVTQITNVEIGTGLKPIVVMPDGSLKQRLTSEGKPLVLVKDQMTTLPENGVLLV